MKQFIKKLESIKKNKPVALGGYAGAYHDGYIDGVEEAVKMLICSDETFRKLTFIKKTMTSSVADSAIGEIEVRKSSNMPHWKLDVIGRPIEFFKNSSDAIAKANKYHQEFLKRFIL